MVEFNNQKLDLYKNQTGGQETSGGLAFVAKPGPASVRTHPKGPWRVVEKGWGVGGVEGLQRRILGWRQGKGGRPVQARPPGGARLLSLCCLGKWVSSIWPLRAPSMAAQGWAVEPTAFKPEVGVIVIPIFQMAFFFFLMFILRWGRGRE